MAGVPLGLLSLGLLGTIQTDSAKQEKKQMTRKKLVTGLALVGLVAGGGVALASGMFGNWPGAGVTPYTNTLPLTGNETVPMDTNLPNGQNPASIIATLAEIWQGKVSSASNTSSFTPATAAVAGGGNMTLRLTGAISGATTVTLPDATTIVAGIPNVVNGYTYLLRFVNVGGTGSGVWTIAAGTGDTITGNATVAVGGSRRFLVTITSGTAVAFADQGN